MSTPKPDRSTWLSKTQAAAALGVTDRTIDRMVQRGQLHPQHHKQPGRATSPFFDPEEIARYTGQLDLVPVPPPAVPAPPMPPAATLSDAGQLAALLASLADQLTSRLTQAVADQLAARDTRVPIPQRLYLTLAEASAYTGLPRGYLQQLIDAGQLRAVEVGKSGKGTKRRVARVDLETLRL